MEAAERQASYGFLRALFCDLPTEEFAVTVVSRAKVYPDEPGSVDILAFWEQAPTEDRLRRIAVDRARLFRGTAPDEVLIPYESLHRGRPAAATAAELASLYERASLRLSADAHESPEYFGVECGFAEHLIDTGQAELEQELLADHLVPFGASVADEMRARAQTGFYRGLGAMMAAFFSQEQARLEACQNS